MSCVFLYQIVQKKEAETELKRCTMAMYVIKEEEDPLQPPHDVGIVIEGVQVLSELPSVPHACARIHQRDIGYRMCFILLMLVFKYIL